MRTLKREMSLQQMIWQLSFQMPECLRYLKIKLETGKFLQILKTGSMSARTISWKDFTKSVTAIFQKLPKGQAWVTRRFSTSIRLQETDKKEGRAFLFSVLKLFYAPVLIRAVNMLCSAVDGTALMKKRIRLFSCKSKKLTVIAVFIIVPHTSRLNSRNE